MELKLENGRYTARSRGDLESVSGIEELRQRVEMKLKARRGGFPPMPEFGSRLHTLHRVKPKQRRAAAEQYAAEALSGEEGLVIEALSLADTGDGGIRLELELKKYDVSFSVWARL